MKVKVLRARAIVYVSQLVAGLARLPEIRSSLRITGPDLLGTSRSTTLKYNWWSFNERAVCVVLSETK